MNDEISGVICDACDGEGFRIRRGQRGECPECQGEGRVGVGILIDITEDPS